MQDFEALKEITALIKKRFLMIISIAILAGVISGIFTFRVTPTYYSSAQFLVNQMSEDEIYQSNQISVNLDLINSYKDLIVSRQILDIVSEELDRPIFANSIEIDNRSGSQIVTLGAFDSDPTDAVILANTVVEVFQKELPGIMQVDNINIISRASTAQKRGPNISLNITIATVLGLIIGVGIVLVLGYLDNTITSEKDVKRQLDLPVLGVIGHAQPRNIKKFHDIFKVNGN
ncbi:YveK family protein [Amphibacillus cookii]|uniref:YveK family protein n=1 Tax=Amphibacillus cookii TaxID=767787 RepID=UPI00195C7F46|nr:Wzz/FepE/Etk N-terminal domain-containing protein [Amphibacillus cookii]MBM7540661.1 capsular polysaccharide biosynthesis protein [Amphibacillus cookii]